RSLPKDIRSRPPCSPNLRPSFRWFKPKQPNLCGLGMTEGYGYRRGDVLLALVSLVTDSDVRKARPVVVIQNDVGNRFSPNLIVAAITSQLPSRDYPTNLVIRRGSPLGAGAGLDRDSNVQAEVIVTIAKSAVVRRLGSFS